MEFNVEYKRKGSVGTNVFIPKKTETVNDEEYILFTNGAKCKVSTFKNDFERINNGDNIETMNENDSSNNIEENDTPINPEEFFKPHVDDNLLDDVEKSIKNPSEFQRSPRKDSRDLTANNIPDDPQPPAHMMNNNDQQPVKYSLSDRLDNKNTDNKNTDNVNKPNKSNRLPEYDIFDRVKSNSELEIVIPFKLTIPKSQKIDTMDDMFESSFIDYLSEKYINETVYTNLDKLKDIIRNSIEEWVDKDLNTKRRKPQVKANTFEIKKEVKQEEKPKKSEKPEESESESEKEIKSKNTDDLTSKLRNGPQVNDGPIDINKLYMINNDREYDAVKKKYDSLKERNPKHPELDRLEDLLETYEANMEYHKQKQKDEEE